MAFGELLRLEAKQICHHEIKTQIRTRKNISVSFLNADLPEVIHHWAVCMELYRTSSNELEPVSTSCMEPLASSLNFISTAYSGPQPIAYPSPPLPQQPYRPSFIFSGLHSKACATISQGFTVT